LYAITCNAMTDRDRDSDQPRRRVSFAEEQIGEHEPLLQDAERAGEGCYPQQTAPELPPTLNPHSNLPIYTTIHR
jgi:hypothetical protein